MKSFFNISKVFLSIMCIVHTDVLYAQWNETTPNSSQPITRSGSIGLGITTPDSKLHINIPLSTSAFRITSPEGNFNFSGHNLTLSSNPSWNQVPYIQWVAPSGLRQAYFGWQKDYLNLSLENGYNFSINGGKVGINLTNPAHNLEVGGTIGANAIYFRNSWNEAHLIGNGENIEYRSSWFHAFYGAISPNPAMFLDARAGKLGIGTSNPLKNFHVEANINDHSALINNASSTGLGLVIGAANDPLRVGGKNSHGGEFFIIKGDGSIGIGTTAPEVGYKLSVNGAIRAKEIKVNTGWSDFVFFEDYKLRPLWEVETYIKENKHLPDVPSAAVVEKEGVNLGEMDAILLRKIEELTLYVIEQNKKSENLEKENEFLKERIKKLENSKNN